MKGKKKLQQKGVSRAKPLLTAKRKQSIRSSKREVSRRATSLSGGARVAEEPESLRTSAQVEGNKGQALPRPTFIPCTLTGPDGNTRSGWEMWLGDHCFGRADNKKLLLASYARLQSPPSSFHWREVRRQRRSFSEEREEREKPKEWKEEMGEGELAWSEEAS